MKTYSARFNSCVEKYIVYKQGLDIKIPERKKFQPRDKNLEITIPLRAGLRVLISSLPEDLSEGEATRICEIIKAYSIK